MLVLLLSMVMTYLFKVTPGLWTNRQVKVGPGVHE